MGQTVSLYGLPGPYEAYGVDDDGLLVDLGPYSPGIAWFSNSFGYEIVLAASLADANIGFEDVEGELQCPVFDIFDYSGSFKQVTQCVFVSSPQVHKGWTFQDNFYGPNRPDYSWTWTEGSFICGSCGQQAQVTPHRSIYTLLGVFAALVFVR